MFQDAALGRAMCGIVLAENIPVVDMVLVQMVGGMDTYT